jgi:hypothetical protein
MQEAIHTSNPSAPSSAQLPGESDPSAPSSAQLPGKSDPSAPSSAQLLGASLQKGDEVQLSVLFEHVHSTVAGVMGLLRADSPGSIAAQLSAAGFVLGPMQMQLQLTYDAFGSIQANPQDELLLEAVTEFSTAVVCLQQAGLALSTLAFRTSCNNPSCSNLSGIMEVQLVSGRSCKCAGCREARYCSKECQGQHWQQHKPVCKSLAAAKAAAAAAASATAAAHP